MADQQAGTITFLFTDIEGSTRRWEVFPAAMRLALQRHDRLLRAVIAEYGGQVFKTIGDAFCAAFATAPEAVAAALAIQRALAAEAWEKIGPLRVRIALHTGAAESRDGDFFGPPLNRVARLLSAGHGGQVLLSRATQELARDQVPPGVSLFDLGEHRLKDLIRPERVYQVLVDDLTREFPPLRTLDTRANNLPAQRTPLVGREREAADVRTRLLDPDVRLLTLTGPGGTGKTRLGLQVAADVLDDFADGAFFIPLASVSDPSVVAPAIVQALALHARDSASPVEVLTEHLRSRQILLLLDNFEQVTAAAPLVSDLLSTCTRLKVLVTSRAVLRVYGEYEVPVPPLELPDVRRLPSVDRLSQYTAVALFIQRAAAVRPDFTVTRENAPAIAEICARLDGLPLAIELAAARVKLLSPQAMLARLEASGQASLQLLNSGARDLPARQQTLRGAVAWSYDLLDADERLLFRRLSVFAGGFDLEAAEAVQGDEALPSVLDGLASLVDKSLLRQEDQPDGEPRFAMLETIRDFGREQLAGDPAGEQVQRRHAEHYLQLAEAADPRIRTREQDPAIRSLLREHANLRAALRWALAVQDAETALRLCGSLGQFWTLRGHTHEARARVEQALRLPGAEQRTRRRARALQAAGAAAWRDQDFDAARATLEESVAIARELGEQQTLAFALGLLGIAVWSAGDLDAAATIARESLSLLDQLGDRWSTSISYAVVARAALERGDSQGARELLLTSLKIRRDVGDRWGEAQVLNSLGDVARAEADFPCASSHYEQSLAVFRELAIGWGAASALHNLGYVAHEMGDQHRAVELFQESLVAFQDVGDRRGIAECLIGLAGVLLHEDPERAARLFAAADRLLAEVGAGVSATNRRDYERHLAAVKEQLGEPAFGTAWTAGHRLTREEAVRLGTSTPRPEPHGVS
ncbi:MAG: tetratricopeptide repeat protein [Chloroflexi bacterium]|nr:tetratricopeptide repeat protein [Chloroflexota bacterium]